MSKILELREKRAKAWEAAKAYLDSKRGGDGLLSAEDNRRLRENGGRRGGAGQGNRATGAPGRP